MQQKQESYRFSEMAYERFPEKPEVQPDFLHTLCRYSTLVVWDGLNHLELGNPSQSEKIFAQIDSTQPKFQMPERARIELLNYQAETFTELGKMEQACTYLEASIHASMSIGSKRRIQEAWDVFQRIQGIWHDEPKVRDLHSLFAHSLSDHTQ